MIMRRRLLFACISLLLALSVAAQGKADFMVKITQAGTLEDAVKALNAGYIRKLTIIGQLNGTDIKYLRSEEVKNFRIDSLDLYDVTLVAGGDSYYTYVNPGGDGDYFSSGTYYVYLSDHEGYEFVDASYVMGVQSKYRWYSNALPYAFAGTPIKCVILPRALKKIGQGMFDSSNYLEEVVMADNITEIGDDSFFRCSSLRKTSQLSSVKRIGSRAFEDCKKLSFDLLDLSSALRIDDSAFLLCELIKSVKLADNCESVGQSAFAGCSSLTSIDYNPDAATIYSSGSFDDSWISGLPVEDNVVYMGRTALRQVAGEFGEHLPELKFREGTLCIAHNFVANRFYKKVELPKSLKRIGDKAFYRGGSGWDGDFYTGIESLELPEGLVDIGKEAFGMYDSEVEVENLIIPASVKHISDRAFYGWRKLKTLRLLGGAEIGRNVFANCEALQHITIGPNVRRLGDDMFEYAYALEDVVFQSRPESSKFTLDDCTFGLFYGNTLLKSVDLPAGTDSIGNRAFYGCAGLTEVGLPQSLVYIGIYAFSGCGSLTEITIPENVTWASRKIEGRDRLADFFSGCKQLKSATILCKDAGYWARLDSLETVRLGDQVETVGEDAFYMCRNIKRVYCSATKVPTAYENTFDKYTIQKDTLYVRADLIEEYKSTVPWNYFLWVTGIDEPSDPDKPDVSDDPDTPDTPDQPQKAFLEYFIDQDPGYGKATVVTEIGAGNNELEFELGSTQPGAHMLYVRTKDEQERWSTTIGHPLYVHPPVNISTVEYFFGNSDPGRGKGVLVIPPVDAAKPYEFEVSLGNLPVGEHTLNVRVKGTDGLWSPTVSRAFTLTDGTGVGSVQADHQPSIIFDLRGMEHNGQRGLHIVRYQNGKTKKVIIK